MDRLTTFSIWNRKYLGAKYRLLQFLLPAMRRETNGYFGRFADPFAGTGVVTSAARVERGCVGVIANDLLYSNYVANACFFGPASPRLPELLAHLNSLEPTWGYVFRNFGYRYFTWDNAAKIDAVREELERLKPTLSEWEFCAALTSLLYAVDRAANTCGQYDAFLKNIYKASYHRGAHVVDDNVRKPLVLTLPMLQRGAPGEARCGDANRLMSQIECDTLYLDPPYNSRQYSDLYHVLENIARWEKPPVTGATKKFARKGLKSAYSRKGEAESALADLIANARCRHLFLSYSDEGLLSHETIMGVLGARGKPKLFEQNYPVFGNGAGRAKRRHVLERLYYVQ